MLKQKDMMIQDLQQKISVLVNKQTQSPEKASESLRQELQKFKNATKESSDKILEKDKQIKTLQTSLKQAESKVKDLDKQIGQKSQSIKEAQKKQDALVAEKDQTITQLEKKNKILKDTITKLNSQQSSQQSKKEEAKPCELSQEVEKELQFVAPILASN